MMKSKRLIIVLLLIWTGVTGFSQGQKKWNHSYTHRYFGIRDGLVQSQVFLSFQDSYGYLWFSTFNGVSRFDGLHFENFSQDDLQIDGRVRYFGQFETDVYMVSAGNIVFVYPDRTMECYPLPDNFQISGNGGVVAVAGHQIYLFNCYQSSKNPWKDFALFRFDLTSKTFTKIAEDLPLLHANVFEEKIVAITWGEINNQQLTVYRIDDDSLKAIQTIPMEMKDFRVLFIQTKRNEWFASIVNGSEPDKKTHLYQCIEENDSIRLNYLMPLPQNEIYSMERLDDHRLLIGIDIPGQSLFVLDTDNRSMEAFPLDMLIVNHILTDRNNNLWFATEEGVYYCSRFFFESFRLGLGRNDNIWGVIKDAHGSVWFSSYMYGFWRADGKGNLYPAQTVYNGRDFPVQFGHMSNCEDSLGRVFQVYSGGIAVFDLKQGNPNRLELIQTGSVLVVYHDRENGKTWFGGQTESSRILNVLDENGVITSFPFDNRHIISICRDGNRKLRIGTFYGEAWLDEENRIIVSDTAQRPYAGVISMSLDEKGILWKGTTHGLFAEDLQGDNRQLSAQPVFFVLHYHNRYIIWGVKDKLHLLDLPAYHRDATVHVRTFDYYDGFDVLECGQNGASIDPEGGYVWLAGGDKAIRFLPDHLMNTPPLQPVTPYLAAIYNADKNSEWSAVQTSLSPIVENKDNFLRFDLLMASVSAPDKLMFRYRLTGYNEQWTTSRERSIIYQNLPFGKYRFEAHSSVDDGGQWSESVFSQPITIRPPFLLTVPGLLLIFFGFASISFLIYYYTRKISIRKEEEKRKIDQLKHRAVQSKFIPHFTANVLNSINYLISNNPESARTYISKFCDFSNQTLRNSDKLYRSLQEELDYARLYLELEKMRYEEKLAYNISIAPGIDTQIEIPTMILQTFCENAIKHGLRPKPEGGKISISVNLKAEYVVITVEDNGIGREKAKEKQTEGTKEGLIIVQQQLEIFNLNHPKEAFLDIEDLFDTYGLPSGTRFELNIPLFFA